MIGRRATIGLSLLCALVFCAFAAQGASAKGTTAFTCSPVPENTGDWKDAHCDEFAGANKGNFAHVVISEKTKTLVDYTNNQTSHETKVTTPALLRGEAAGLKVEINCTEVTGKATITNEEIEKVMQNKGTEISTEFSKCTVLRPENAAEERHPCKVKEPITQTGTSITKENVGAGGKEMGVEIKPEGEVFATITFEGANCPEGLKKEKFTVTTTTGVVGTGSRGSSEATTGSGATLWLTTAMTGETLKFAGKAAEFSTRLTPTMYNKETGKTENPITYTTTTP